MQHDGHGILSNIIAEVSRVVVGKDDAKELLLVALLSQGHVLIEGLPGTAKTTIARSFAMAIGGKFKRQPEGSMLVALYQQASSSLSLGRKLTGNTNLASMNLTHLILK